MSGAADGERGLQVQGRDGDASGGDPAQRGPHLRLQFRLRRPGSRDHALLVRRVVRQPEIRMRARYAQLRVGSFCSFGNDFDVLFKTILR